MAAPIGTGPFKFAEWKSNQLVAAERNEDYWDGAPSLEAVGFRPVADANTRVAEMMAGGIDIMVEVPPDNLSAFRSDPTPGSTTTNATNTAVDAPYLSVAQKVEVLLAVGDHALDFATRCNTRTGEQLGDALRPIVARLGARTRIARSRPVARHRFPVRSLRGKRHDFSGAWMLFGKRKRIVNRILIVEDEPLTAFDNEVMIGDLGYEVVATLDSFEDAIQLLDGEQVDLILSDYRLSGERSGLDLARAAKNRGIPIIFSTGHELPPESVQLAVGCIAKPYSERTLKLALNAVDRHLSGARVKKPPKGVDLFVADED